MGWLQHNTGVDVGQPFASEPDTGMPAALIRAEQEEGLVIVASSQHSWLSAAGHCPKESG